MSSDPTARSAAPTAEKLKTPDAFRQRSDRGQALSVTTTRPRLLWLDILRLLCAVQIVGFHWLRACFANGLLGPINMPSLVTGYRDTGLGLSELPLFIIDQRDTLPAFANSFIGLAAGLGWQAVNVFILLSGLTFAMQAGRGMVRPGLAAWYRRRLGRILTPYYAVALPCLAAAFVFIAFAKGRGGIAGRLGGKVAAMLPAPPAETLLGHLLLADPARHHWTVDFFAPAWWFLPAILVGHLAFPLLLRLVERFGAMPMLGAALAISVVSYRLSQDGYLVENAWYFVVAQELFSFVLGIVAGRALADPGKQQRLIETMRRGGALTCGLVLLALGNLANWFPCSYPVCSVFITPGLTLILAWIALHAARRPVIARIARGLERATRCASSGWRGLRAISVVSGS